METKNLLKYEASRMEAYRLLSDCHFMPNEGLTAKLEALEVKVSDVCKPAIEFVRNMRKTFESGAQIEPLKVDYAKLFVGPFKLFAAPYGSVYLDGERKVMGDSTLDVQNRYRQAGLDTAGNFKDAPDHIAAELEFMYYLIFKEIESFSNSDPAAAVGSIRKPKSFLKDHLMAWVPEFADNIIKNAENPFYPNLARVTEIFLKENYEIVSRFLDSKKLNSEKPVEINSLRV